MVGKNPLEPKLAPSPRQDREGERMIGAHFPEEIHRAFRVLAAKRGITTRAMMAEAVADLFAKHNEPVPQALQNLQLRKRRAKAAAAIVG